MSSRRRPQRREGLLDRRQVLVTVQPSSLLRGPLEGRAEAFMAFNDDLAQARQVFERR